MDKKTSKLTVYKDGVEVASGEPGTTEVKFAKV